MIYPPIKVETHKELPNTFGVTWIMRVRDERVPSEKQESISTTEPSGVFHPGRVAELIKRAENYVRENGKA